MNYLLKVIGEDHICLGSDYPFPLGEKEPGKLISKMKMDKKTRKKIESQNALDWLNIKESNK